VPLVGLKPKIENLQQNAVPTVLTRQLTNMLHSSVISQCVPVHSNFLSVFIMSYLGCMQIKRL